MYSSAGNKEVPLVSLAVNAYFFLVGNGHEIWVLTSKEGLLSHMAHDLKMRAENVRWAYEPRQKRLEVWVPAAGLKVEAASTSGEYSTDLLSSSDKAKIENHMHNEVLEAQRFPQIHFQTQEVSDKEVLGALTLHGVTRPLRFAYRREGEYWWAEVMLDQRDFGIAPFKAMMGTLKVAPVVKVVAKIPVSSTVAAP